MRRLALAVVLVLAATPATPARAASRDCGPESATTISRNSLVRLYSIQRGAGEKRYYACARPRGRPIRLDDSIDKLVLRGRYVSDTVNVCDTTGCWFIVEILDVLRNESIAYERELPGSAQKLVATRRGETALLAVTPDRTEHYLVKLDAMGISDVDRGPDIHSLRLHRRTLHWLHGAQERTAPVAHVLKCGPTRGVDSVALGRHVRVYSVYVDSTNTDEEFDDYYACARPGGKPVKLARIDVTIYSGSGGAFSEDIYDFAFAENFVAFAKVGCAFGSCDSSLWVFDVGRGRLARRISHLTGAVDTVVVSARGGAGALVRANRHSPEPPDSYVLGLDSSGQREFDRGPDVRALTLDGNTLRWFNGSQARSAELR